MGSKLKKKGEAGAAKNYLTRSQALRKLQCTLADFRRLCILKGIFPREPKNKRKISKKASANATFYYYKDIQYLLHEPVLAKLREHKAFAKKLSRALVRTDYSLAKSLEESRPTYRLDHIIKERYPTFTDALKDLDDALSLIILFAHLPSNQQVSSNTVQNCAKLAAEWQLYVMKSRTLRKVFLSIKGIYFQAEVKGQSITWLVPYQFTPNVPTDVDFRIMLTFLDLYQTLLGFVYYKLYSDINLIYPPKIDETRDSSAAGLGALLLQESNARLTIQEPSDSASNPRKVTAKEVKNQIRQITQNQSTLVEDELPSAEPDSELAQIEEEIDTVNSNDDQINLFEPFYFFLSREVTRPTLEFCLRSFGGNVGWDPVLGSGSPFTETDSRITHHIIDRPPAPQPITYPGIRSLVQPQWVIDCINARKLLSVGPYGPGMILPPHLSPFVSDEESKRDGIYVPTEDVEVVEGEEEESEEEEVEVEEESEEQEEGEFTGIGLLDSDAPSSAEEEEVPKTLPTQTSAFDLAVRNPQNESLKHQAELEAESLGIPFAHFEKNLTKAIKLSKSKTQGQVKADQVTNASKLEPDNSILLTGKKRNQFKRLSQAKTEKAKEREKLLAKRKAIVKSQRATKA